MKHSGRIKVMVIAGGSGGHVLPAVGFCQELKEVRSEGAEIFFVTTPKFKGLAEGLRPILLDVDRSAGGLMRLVLSSFVLVRKIRPDIVVGFGGYVSVPFLILAKLAGAKTILHEQNVVPGRANRFLSLGVDKIAISFSETSKFLKRCQRKTYLARYPFRSSLRRIPREEALRFFGFRPDLRTLLVMGGSQGAHSLNEKFLEALGPDQKWGKLQIIHLAGRDDREAVARAYAEKRIEAKVFDFLPEMHYAYSAADLVISRAGAGSVFEIMFFGLPSVLVPYPFAGAHQAANARVVAEKGGAILLEDAKMTPDLLGGLLGILIEDEFRRRTMSSIVTSLFRASCNLKISDLL